MGSKAEISFGLYDVTAKDDGSPACQDVQPFVDLAQLIEAELVVEKYATCERNHFVLDGSMKLFPDDPENHSFGLWSRSMSGEDGMFPEPIVLTIEFAENHSSLGLTFRFSEATGDYCNDLNIKWYDSAGELMADLDYTPDSAHYFAANQVQDYRRVVLTFRRMNRACRYLKLTEILYGALKIFGEDALISADILEEIDPISGTLSINTLDFQIQTSDFYILDMRGVYAMLQKKQQVDVVEYVDEEKVTMGTFYLDEPESYSDNTTTMSCIDAIGIMDQTTFRGGLYSGATAESIVAEIATSARVDYDMDPSLSAVPLAGWIPLCTHREALQQVALAIGAVVDCSRSDKVQLYPIPEVGQGQITHAGKLDGHKVKLLSLVTGVGVVAHSYLTTQEEREIQNAQMTAGTHEITFGEPMHSLTVTGASILQSNANYARIEVMTPGTVLLRGKAYNDVKTIYAVNTPELPANEKANVLRIEDATLVGPGNAQAVAQRVYDYYQLRYQDTGDLILSTESVGQRTVMDWVNGRRIEGIIESLDIDLVGGFLANAKITGKAVEL